MALARANARLSRSPLGTSLLQLSGVDCGGWSGKFGDIASIKNLAINVFSTVDCLGKSAP